MNTMASNTAEMPPKITQPSADTFRGRCARQLNKLREDAGYDVEDAAAAIRKSGHDISTQGLYKWLSGARAIPYDAFPAIAKAFRCSMTDLIPKR